MTFGEDYRPKNPPKVIVNRRSRKQMSEREGECQTNSPAWLNVLSGSEGRERQGKPKSRMS